MYHARGGRQVVDVSLDAVGLADVADRTAGTYSGGMIRRLELARALVNAPRLLVLDEPTIGLDPIGRANVWDRIGEVRASTGMTVLVTTHYMEEADQHCDRIALMHRGMLVVQNSVAQRDVGVASGAATLFRTIGGSIGVSLLGTLFTQQVQSALPDRASGAPAGGQITPGMLGQLPAPLREAYQAAITNGIHQVFLWGSVIAVVALIAAWAIREVPLRGSTSRVTTAREAR